ncbi:MAG: hypothetical protein DI533_15470 [Cereibacter sphaeroides]|uniref:WbqC-like family protein n=1 Tax=Cereibacter sphaeroides TaxID=1063 RepID=A0A2W5S1T6_CERSP|nr:MAG: hypothetical protein DI533_15470 [Cereibacter sphaeroides]
MHVAIMQPYFLPYIGYFQLVEAVDRFVVYDTVEYTKKGWINRNRMLRNGEAVMFSVPLKKDSDFLQVRDRRLADDFDPVKLGNQFAGAYRKAQQFDLVMPVLREILSYKSANLFDYIRNSLDRCCDYLGITTPIVASSEIETSSGLRGTARVLSLCDALGADRYTNAIGGLDLYRSSEFAARGIALRFLRSRPDPYPQGGEPFQPYLSIIDVMMHNPVEDIRTMLREGFDIVDGREESDVSLAETR